MDDVFVSSINVIPVLRMEYAIWIDGLTTEEIRAIKKYTWNSKEWLPLSFYKRMNAALRGDYAGPDLGMLLYYANVISGAINRHPLEHNIICYRGSNVDETHGKPVGTKFIAKQFNSTSVVSSKALKKKYQTEIFVPVGARGAYIEMLSRFPKQREFLLDKNTVYRIKSRQEGIIHLEVIV